MHQYEFSLYHDVPSDLFVAIFEIILFAIEYLVQVILLGCKKLTDNYCGKIL